MRADDDTTQAKEYIEERLPFHALQRYAFHRVRLTSDWVWATNSALTCLTSVLLTQTDAPTSLKIVFGAIAGISGFIGICAAADATGSERPQLEQSRALLRPEHIAEVEDKLRDTKLREKFLHFRYLADFR